MWSSHCGTPQAWRNVKLAPRQARPAALERLVLPALRGFGGEVRAQGVPHRLGTLDSGCLQLVNAFARPKTKGATVEARRKWAAWLLLVSRRSARLWRRQRQGTCACAQV